MVPMPSLELLKKGLSVLESQVKERSGRLKALLAANKPISSEDEQWLDCEANLVDELQVVEVLEQATDYQKALETLNDMQKSIVMKLREAGGEFPKLAGKKRKRVCPSFDCDCQN